MSRESFVFVIGLIVFLTSFLGIPQDWKKFIFIAGGILLMILGYSLRRTAFLRSVDSGNGERRGDAFVERVHAKKEDFENNMDEDDNSRE